MNKQNDKPLRRDVLRSQPLALHLQVLTRVLQAEHQAPGYEFDTDQIIDQSALQVGTLSRASAQVVPDLPHQYQQ